MKAQELAAFLVGKTVAEVKHFCGGPGWPMCVESITFTDGTVIEFAGSADEARLSFGKLPDGSFLDVEDECGDWIA